MGYSYHLITHIWVISYKPRIQTPDPQRIPGGLGAWHQQLRVASSRSLRLHLPGCEGTGRSQARHPRQAVLLWEWKGKGAKVLDMVFWWFSDGFVMDCWWIVDDFLMDCWWIADGFLMVWNVLDGFASKQTLAFSLQRWDFTQQNNWDVTNQDGDLNNRTNLSEG